MEISTLLHSPRRELIILCLFVMCVVCVYYCLAGEHVPKRGITFFQRNLQLLLGPAVL